MSDESQNPPSGPPGSVPETPSVDRAVDPNAIDPNEGALPPFPLNSSKYPKEQTEKKLIAGIMAIVLGSFGVHKFYLGYTTEGVFMLIVGILGFLTCGILTLPVAVIGIMEGIKYLTKSDEEFVETYVIGRKPWF